MMKKYFVLFLVMLSLAASVWSAGSTHVIMYYPPYKDQAQALANICRNQWGIETTIRDISGMKASAGGKVLYVSPIAGENGRWAINWDSLKVNDDIVVNDPRAMLYAKGVGTLDSITILGNQLEVPPSLVTAGSGRGLNDGASGAGTDFYYGVPFAGATVSSYIPYAGVSRIPVNLLNRATQSAQFSMGNVSLSYIEAFHQTNNAALYVPGSSLSINLTIAGDNVSFPFYQPVTHVAGDLGGGKYKIAVTNYDSSSTHAYTIADKVNFPYLIQRSNRASIVETPGAFVLLGTGKTPGDVVEMLDPLQYGKSSVLVQDSVYPLATLATNVEVASYAGSGVMRLAPASLSPFGYSLPALETDINNNTLSVYMITDDSSIYAVTSFTANDASSTGNTITVSTTIGDVLPVKAEDIAGKKFKLYDGTAMKTYLRSLGTVSGVSFLNSGVFKTLPNGSSRVVGTTGALYNLTASANAIIAKCQAYNDYLWQNNKKLDSAQKALVVATGVGNYWDYAYEHAALNIINGQDSSDTGLISVMDGFKIDKVFSSTPDSNPYAFDWTPPINEVWGRGVVLGLENWQSMFGSSNINLTNLTQLPAVTVTDGSQRLPFLIGAGAGGYDLEYSSAAISSQTVGIAEYLFTNTTTTTPGVSYTGIHSYLGPVNAEWVVQEGRWDKGVFSPIMVDRQKMWNRHFLLKEATKQYTTAAQPVLSSIWRESIMALLQDRVNESVTDNITTTEEAAVDLIRLLETWGMLGIAAQPLPIHQTFPRSGRLPGDVPKPEIKINSTALRAVNPYDRFETPIIEVPTVGDRSGNVTVTISIENLYDTYDNANNLLSRGLFDYDANIKFKFTLVSVPLQKADVFAYQGINELSHMMGGGGDVASSDICYETIIDGGKNSVSYPFYEHWTNGGTGLLKRGPGMYMIRVEAQEKARADNTGLYDSQKYAQYTKEARLFFKVTNEFIPKASASVLLVNNTDHNPYQQVMNNMGGRVPDYVPNVAIRYYESALDNYQYTAGTLTKKDDSVGTGKVLLASDNVGVTFWLDRVVAGDKIRVQDKNGVFTPWMRIDSVTSTGNLVVLDPGASLATTDNFAKSEYLIQRAYTSGTASIEYDATGGFWTKVDMSDTVTLTIPNEQYLSAVANGIIKAGDFFKLLDGRVYEKIKNVGPAFVVGNSTTVTLTLENKYPHENLLVYHGDLPVPVSWWEGTARINPFSANTIRGSYAIYPPNPNPDKANEPNYFYQTWNVHNFVTSNNLGMGLHGDISSLVLDAFAAGDTLGHRHKLIVVANDAGYGWDPDTTVELPNERNRKLSDDPLTFVILGQDYFYFSDTDKAYFDAFLSKGGRIMTGGQHASPINHSFFKVSLGINGVENSSETAIKKVEGDILSNEFNNQLSIQDGFAEGETSSVETEALKTNVVPKKLLLAEGQAKAIFNYVGTDALAASSPAAIRASGGDTYQPYAAVYLGFDFATISVSGTLNRYSDLSMQGSDKGRNFFMKKSIDWLRDPTRTSEAERVKVDYHALNRDGTTTVIGLKTGDKINDNLHFLNQTSAQLTGVGPNQKIKLSASGGKLYGYTLYQWSFVGAGNLVIDSAAPNNADQHQVIFTTGPDTNVTYTVKLRSPDGEELQIEVITREQPLIVYAPDINAAVLASPIVDNNISVSTIIGGAGNVRIRAIGGDGLNSYNFSLVNDNSIFTTNPTQRLKLEDSQTVQYYLPDGATITSKKTVAIQVKSGSTTATASITIYPKLNIEPTPQEYVVGGTEPRFTVTGGKPSDAAGVVIGYTFTGSSGLTVTADPDGLKATATAASTTIGSTNPLSPSNYNVVATDKNFTTASVTGQVKMFAAPWIRQFVMGTTGNTFAEVVSGQTFEMSSTGNLYFAITGGNGTTQIMVNDSTGGVANTDLTKDILNSDPFNQTTSVASESISTTESIVMNYVSGNIFSISTGVTNGSITLTLTSGGSSKNTVLNFSSPLTVNVAKGNNDLAVYDGVNISLRAYGSGQLSGANTLLQMTSVSGTAPFKWTMSPANLGSFISAADYSAYHGSLTQPVALPSPQTQALVSEKVYFIAGSLNQSGFLSVTDDNGQTATIVISISGVDPMSWTSETGTKAQTAYFRSRVSYSFTGGSAPYTISIPSGLTATLKITGSTAATPAAGVPLTMTTADGKNGLFRFDLTGTGVAGEGRITVTDKNGLTLQSSIVKFTASSSSGTTTIVQGPPVVSATLPGSGGGGGCLLD